VTQWSLLDVDDVIAIYRFHCLFVVGYRSRTLTVHSYTDFLVWYIK